MNHLFDREEYTQKNTRWLQLLVIHNISIMKIQHWYRKYSWKWFEVS